MFPPPRTPTSQVELRLGCKSLRRADFLSKSDPFAVIFALANGKRAEIGRTETIKDTHDPMFKKAFVLDYYFEEVQQFLVQVYDRDAESESLEKHDFLGQVEVTLGRIMGARGQTMRLNLVDPKKRNADCGLLQLWGEEVAACADVISFQCVGIKLDNKDGWFGKSDPFINIQRSREDGTWLTVWSSEVIMDNLNPIWKPVEISVQTLCNGDYSRPLRFECMDWERSTKHQLIGCFETTLKDLCAEIDKSYDLINKERQRKKGKRYKNSGMLQLKQVRSFRRRSFLEYLRGGCEINFIAAIDYTASNGAPSVSSSLHYMNPHAMNQYQTAIHMTGSILQEYDADQQFPVYGFGGKVSGQVSHCFPLTFDPNHPEVHGVEGILQAYQNSFSFVSLSGPTLFAPVIQTASHIASQCGGQKYIVLMILTDGVIMDMKQTVDAIVYASHLPLSIIIVGVGNADFSAMDALDADDKLLQSSTGQVAIRDIVQFVPFNRYQNNISLLTKETLAELPNQLVGFMQARNIQPNPPIEASNSFRSNHATSMHIPQRGIPPSNPVHLSASLPPTAAPSFTGQSAPSAPSAPSIPNPIAPAFLPSAPAYTSTYSSQV